MRYLEIYEQVKHLPEITCHTLRDKCRIPIRNCFKYLQTMENNFLIKKTRSTFSDAGHEMFVYASIDQTRCQKCKQKDVKFYQNVMCSDCLHAEFEKFIPVINMVRG